MLVLNIYNRPRPRRCSNVDYFDSKKLEKPITEFTKNAEMTANKKLISISRLDIIIFSFHSFEVKP